MPSTIPRVLRSQVPAVQTPTGFLGTDILCKFFSRALVHRFDAGLSIVIPVRGAHKIANLATTISHINSYGFSNIEFVIAEESAIQEIYPDAFVPAGVAFKYKHISAATHFNKSRAVNSGGASFIV